MLRALALCSLCLATLTACLPPPRSAIVRGGALSERHPLPPLPVDGGCGPAANAFPIVRTCTAAGFEALADTLAPDRIDARTWRGDLVSGRSILLRRDTARIGDRSLPLAALRRIDLVDEPGAWTVAARLAVPTATLAALGAALGLTQGLDGAVDGVLVGAGFGLAAGMTLGRAPTVERFDVIGWEDPPLGFVRLDADADGCASVVLPGEMAQYADHLACLSPEAYADRSRATWVRQIDVHLRSGERLAGARLALAEDGLALDGRALRYEAVDRIVLRHPRPPAAPLRSTATATATGALYGAMLTAGPALAAADADVLWIGAASGAALGAAFGVFREWIRPRDAVREEAVLPTPEP